MTPGDIARIARSDEIVFRAIFKNTPPSNKEMYWRGIVYANFVDGTWSAASVPKNRSDIPRVDWVRDKKTSLFVPDLTNLDKISYSVLLEPTYDRWLFGLDFALPKTESTGLTYDYRLENRFPVRSLLRYEVDTYPEATLNISLPELLRIQTTRFEAGDNPRTANFARNLYAESSNKEEFIENVLTHIRKQPYHYTLEPPTLKRSNSIDQFWFDTRSGFCAHYAGAFVYIMRAAGIPARMVGGYQGGEINPLTEHVVIRQYLAHAWAEIWLPNKGWQRVDPTAAVAPSRINEGLNVALSASDLSSLSTFTNVRLNKVLGMQKLMFLFESLEHRWNLFVIGYNSERQMDFLHKLLGKFTAIKFILVFFAGALLSLVFVAISLFWSRGKRSAHPVIKSFQTFTHRLRKLGLNHRPDESPSQFIKKIGAERGLEEKDYHPTIKMLNELLYNPSEQYTKDKLKLLKSNLRSLQLKLALQTHK